MAKRHERTQARRVALQLLYAAEISGEDIAESLAEGRVPDEIDRVDEYARRLAAGVMEEAADLDEYLDEASENWAVERMPIVDRLVMRIAMFEMLYVKEVPVSVSINEAVELAKDFGGEDDSHRFVNGVLGNIAKNLNELREAHVARELAWRNADAQVEEPGESAAAGEDSEIAAAAEEAPAELAAAAAAGEDATAEATAEAPAELAAAEEAPAELAPAEEEAGSSEQAEQA